MEEEEGDAVGSTPTAPEKMGTTESVAQDDVLCVCILPPAIWADPQVRLLLELRAISRGAGSKTRLSMRGMQLALRLAAVRLGMSGLPGWWAKVPAMREVEMLLFLHSGGDEEEFFETFSPHESLRTIIEAAAAQLAAQEAAL